MIGFKTLAVPGPTNMPFEIRQAMDVALEDHRAPDLPDFTLPLFEDLKNHMILTLILKPSWLHLGPQHGTQNH